MNKTLRRLLKSLLLILLVLVLLVGVVGVILPRQSYPQVEGEITLAGLDAPVDILRDQSGVPHIYATTTHDLFFAQGYVHAQDRFWQMDAWRHASSGRLSEMFGESQVETDQFLRTLGWERVVLQELEMVDPQTLLILESYAEGVNAYLADHEGVALSLEYAVLGLLSPDYKPAPWEPKHSLTWAKAMAYDLGGNMSAEVMRATLLKTLSAEQVDQLFPAYPADNPLIVPDFKISGGDTPSTNPDTLVWGDLAPALQQVLHQGNLAEQVLGEMGEGIGSNNWVISGQRTASGMPILANDMHLGERIPSIWYEVDLQCVPQGSDCPFRVSGYSFASLPGVIVGHNDRIAWGFTNVGPDVQDLYIEKINPANPNQYEYMGKWEDMTLVDETIQVVGGDPVNLTVRYTHHGPVITEVYGQVENFAEEAGVDLPELHAISLSWTALQPGEALRAFVGINLARNWDEFRTAASYFPAPSQNMVYADVEGNIGYQTPGWIPVRNAGHDGQLPVPGWTGEYDWQGYIPFEELPHSYNPPQGYIVTANNAVVGTDYPYLIASQWAHGFRARRIVDMIEQSPGKITVETIQQMHGDNMDLGAQALVPVLLQVPLSDERLLSARQLLADWDYQDHMDSAAAALYNVFWTRLLKATFGDDLPEDMAPGGGERWFEIMRQIAQDPASAWWDNRSTDELEQRDAIFAAAFAAAVDELEQAQGKEPAKWSWGDLHTIVFHHETLGKSGIAAIEAMFNRGPYRTSGGAGIVNATGWDATQPYQVRSVPSERLIVDLSDLNATLSTHTTGQSGHAYHPHYADMIDDWRNIQYHPLWWARADVEAHQKGALRLVPGK